MKRREDNAEATRGDLARVLEHLPGLGVLRRIAGRVTWLFDTPEDPHRTGCRRAAILREPAFGAVSEPAEGMEQLDDGGSPG